MGGWVFLSFSSSFTFFDVGARLGDVLLEDRADPHPSHRDGGLAFLPEVFEEGFQGAWSEWVGGWVGEEEEEEEETVRMRCCGLREGKWVGR